MHKVVIGSNTYFAEDGASLGEIIINSGIAHSHPCGGMGSCKKCTVKVNGKEELSCRYKIHSDITVQLNDSENIYSETGALITEQKSEDTVYVLDIGTTTLALAVVDQKNKCTVKVITETNPQRVFGADVMSRIDYCMKNGTEKMQQAVIQKINLMTKKCCDYPSDTLFVSGNTTMLHIFFGIDCSSMGKAPYTPVFLESKQEKGEKLGLTGINTVYSLPSISSFVGADITAGLNFVSFPEKGKYSLLADLGTNAEIVLFSGDSIICTAAAAGPCFEGANITCGMSASAGAVSEYRSGADYKTIGDEKPKGICGTGLIDIITVLLKNEIIDETGFMECEKFRITDDVYLTGGDVRQFQLAKSAIYSGIMTLMKNKGITADDIEHLYISGGFSAKINIDNAVFVGLLPKDLKTKCIALNNSSLLGTVKYAIENNNLEQITKNAEYTDLAADSVFTELFMENMMFNL